ncbi:MAG: hydrogenase [Epsilonproteobacteria bacterium]|nr:hydrogenase [Campylobacterota bacterium]
MNNLFIELFLATSILTLFSSRLYSLFGWYLLNSLMLSLVALTIGFQSGDHSMMISGGITMFLKVIIVPYVLKSLSEKHKLSRQIAPNIKSQYSVLLIPAMLVFTFYLAEPIVEVMSHHANYIAIGVSSMFFALLLIIQQSTIMPKIVGFLMLENSIFLLGTTATDGMPLEIEFGIFLDFLMTIVIIILAFEKEEVQA